jgi:hypothetical protein
MVVIWIAPRLQQHIQVAAAYVEARPEDVREQRRDHRLRRVWQQPLRFLHAVPTTHSCGTRRTPGPAARARRRRPQWPRRLNAQWLSAHPPGESGIAFDHTSLANASSPSERASAPVELHSGGGLRRSTACASTWAVPLLKGHDMLRLMLVASACAAVRANCSNALAARSSGDKRGGGWWRRSQQITSNT